MRLLQAQERELLRDLRQAIDKRIENKIASARRFAVSTVTEVTVEVFLWAVKRRPDSYQDFDETDKWQKRIYLLCLKVV